jgi:hypothetical protein
MWTISDLNWNLNLNFRVAHSSRAVRQAIEAGVKCIDHGQLLGQSKRDPSSRKALLWMTARGGVCAESMVFGGAWRGTLGS